MCFTETGGTRGTRSVSGNTWERRLRRIQRAGVGAAVETARAKASIGRFGHRKRGCEATSSPSAPATEKALKPLGFKAFSSLWRGRRTSVLPHFGAQKWGEFRIRRHPVTTVPSAPSSKQHQNFSSGCVPAGVSLFSAVQILPTRAAAQVGISAYISKPSVIPFSLAVSFLT